MLGDAISAKKSSGQASESREIVDVASLLARSVTPAVPAAEQSAPPSPPEAASPQPPAAGPG
jgi:hypothetical protein